MLENWRNCGLPDIGPLVVPMEALGSAMRSRAAVRQWRDFAASIAMRSTDARRAVAGIPRWAFASLLILWFLLLGEVGALSQVVACKPLLSTQTVREVRPSSPQPLPWSWHATIVADTSFCASRSGRFEMDFIRIKEYAPDLQFTQRFQWSQKQFDISMELSPDEAILEFRIGFISPCVCRDTSEFLIEPREK